MSSSADTAQVQQRREDGKLARNVTIVGALALFLFVLFVGTGSFLATRGLDAGVVGQIALTAAVRGLEGGYRTVAFIYGHTNAAIRTAIILIFGGVFIGVCLWPLRRRATLGLVFIMLIAPITLSLTQFTKDLMLIPFVLATLALMQSRVPSIFKLFGIALIYAIYAQLFRGYYFAIAGVFVALYFAKFIPLWARLLLGAILLVGLWAAPSDLFWKLQSGRDAVNIRRVGYDIPGARTAFMNLVSPTSYPHFLLNYGYSALRLNMPVLFSVRPQELYLFANVMAYALLAFSGLRIHGVLQGRLTRALGSRQAWAAQTGATLFSAHVILLLCFEPDLGSYLRHMSSALPYLVPTLIAYDRLSPMADANGRHWKRSGYGGGASRKDDYAVARVKPSGREA